MHRNSKAKSVICAEVPLQHAVAVIDSNTSVVSLEKRKKDADKPLYLKRV
ncbi:hypothetical protein MUP38_00255 [Candidatus Bathyarchaeota archaeon]|nr:hypothetical protein [Candidatus Bathyarchaeota archaeon]